MLVEVYVIHIFRDSVSKCECVNVCVRYDVCFYIMTFLVDYKLQCHQAVCHYKYCLQYYLVCDY